MEQELNDPWLVAVWPGMGGIAQIAGATLVQQLGARRMAEIRPEPYFDPSSIQVSGGLIRPGALPKSVFFAWKNPSGGRDLVVFVGEQQPTDKVRSYCNELVTVALELGVRRLFTFAAMASPIRPDDEPRVFFAATDPELLAEVKSLGVAPLEEAGISGLNGVLLAVAHERGLEGVCLLGEFPFFARAIANPKSSAAVLRTFGSLSGITPELGPLEEQASQVERVLVDHMRALEAAAAQASETANGGKSEVPEDWPKPERLDPEVAARIEDLFTRSKADRSKALELKAELDRHGVFEKFEDRFLDLFKQAE